MRSAQSTPSRRLWVLSVTLSLVAALVMPALGPAMAAPDPRISDTAVEPATVPVRGTVVTSTAARGAGEVSARLEVRQQGDAAAGEVGLEQEPSGFEPAAATSRVGPLLGTIGFRSASARFKGLYVTTLLDNSGKRGTTLRARTSPNLLTLEMGLFRDGNGRFKLLGENGKWVARQNGSLGARTSSWSQAWAFKAVRPTGSTKESLVCLVAYSGGRVRGLAKLKLNGTLDIQSTTSLASAKSKCTVGNARALFYTDALPRKSSSLSSLLAAPASPVDRITRVRFVPPDRKVTLRARDRRDAILAIDAYFNSFNDYVNYLRANTWDQLDAVADPLTVADSFDPGEEKESVDWFGIGIGAAGAVFDWVDTFPIADNVAMAFKIAAAAVETVAVLTEIGFGAQTEIDNANRAAPRRIPGVTTATVGSLSQMRARITSDHIRQRDNLQLLHRLIKQGCSTPTKACDRRLAQWLKAPPLWPSQWGAIADRHIYEKKSEFMRELLPIRGRLYAADGPDGWTHVSSEDWDGPYHVRYVLGDEGEGTTYGFGRKQNPQYFQQYVLYTSVWRPWYHVSWEDSLWDPGWRERPKQLAWAIGLKGDDEKVATELMQTSFELLFEPENPDSPLEGGMGLSYKEVACEWLTNAVYATYNKRSGNEVGDPFDPCHFSFYDLSAQSPTLINNPERWVRPDKTPVATYSADSTIAVALWVPDLLELQADRDSDDPDIFSWQIPHLQFGAPMANPANYPRSVPKGTSQSTPVYFANLTQGPVTIHQVYPGGAISGPLGDPIPRWSELDQLYRENPVGKPIAYGRQSSGIWRLGDAYVGATYLVRTADSTDVGTYTVEAPPPGPSACRHEPSALGTCQVAEIHGHFVGSDNDGILDDPNIGK